MSSKLVDLRDVRQRLKEFFGLSEYEARAYITLLRTEAPTIKELSHLSGIPRSKCYFVVRGLTSKNMIHLIPSKPVKCKAVSPETAVGIRLSHYRHETQRKREEAEELVLHLSQMMSKASSSLEGLRPEVLLVEGADAVLASVETGLREAKEEVLVAISSSPVRFDWMRLGVAMQSLISKGGVFKYLVPSRERFLESVSANLRFRDEMTVLRELMDRGRVEIKGSRHTLQPFAVIDAKVVHLFFTDPPRNQLLSTLMIRDRRFAGHMKNHFYALWTGDS